MATGKDVSDMAALPDRWPARNSRPTSSSPHPRLNLIREGQARQKRFTISTASLTAYLLEYLRLLPLAAGPFSRLLPIGTPAVPRGLLANVRKVYEALDSQNSAKIDASVRACLVTIHGYSGLFVTIRDCRPTVTTVTCPALPWRLRPGSIDFQSTEITSCPAPPPSPAKQSKTFAAAGGWELLACVHSHSLALVCRNRPRLQPISAQASVRQ